MLPRAVAVAVLSSIAIAASGCGGDSDPEAEFRAAFEKEFSAAPWYHHITAMEVKDGTLEITTDLDSPSKAGEIERGICGRAATLALDLGVLGDLFRGVVTTGSDGAELGGCG